MLATPEEHQTICEAIREGENIAKRITDLVAKLKPLVQSDISEPVQAESPQLEESDARDQKPAPVIANELKGY